MAKQVKQFRYYSDNISDIENNSPTNINMSSLESGEIFSGYMPISKIGIQSIPGTEFYLNDSTQPIIIGHTGIFELDLSDQIEIIALKFDPRSLQFINNNINAYLIIDMVCEGGNAL